MKLKSKLFSILLVVVLAFSLAACSSDSEGNGSETNGSETNKTDESNKEDKTVVTVWTGDRHDLEYVNAKIEEYNSTNTDGIEIDYQVMTEDYVNMITMAASSNQSPDLFIVSSSLAGFDLKTFVNSDIIQSIPLDKLTDEYKKVNDLDNVLFEGVNVLGEDVYYIPSGMRSGSRIIYNKDLFEAAGVEVPTKLSELVDVAKVLTEKGEGVSYGTIFPGQSSPFERWLEGVSEKSGVLPYDFVNGKFNFDGYKPILEEAIRLFDEGSVFPGAVSMQIDPTRAQFSEGNVAFYGGASQEVGVLTEQFPAKSEWGIADLPTVDGEVKGALSINPQRGLILTKDSNVEASLKVIEFFGSEDYLKGYLEGGYALPISSHMASVVDASKTGRLAEYSLKDYESVYPKYPQITPEGDSFRVAFWNVIQPGGPGVDETIANLNESYNAVLDKEVELGKVSRIVIKDFDALNPNEGTIEYLSE